ncbi:hypothetical protein Csa_008835 [Cucumis sativus]|nr:hypothetical protein Csa_008835 [Cucumis sativus]
MSHLDSTLFAPASSFLFDSSAFLLFRVFAHEKPIPAKRRSQSKLSSHSIFREEGFTLALPA